LDLVPYRYGLLYGPTRPTRRIPIWLPPGGRKTMDALAETFGSDGEPPTDFWKSVFELRRYDPAETLRIGDLSVSFAPTQHYVPCFAFRIAGEDGRALV